MKIGRPGRPGSIAAGLAAAFVVAFLTGFLARGGLDNRPISETAGQTRYVARTTQTSPPTQPARRPPPARPLELWSAANGAGSRVRLPLLTADAGADSDALRQPSALPEYVRRQLERQGYEVEGDRQVLSLALEDGRSVDVPIERLKYRYVGYRVH